MSEVDINDFEEEEVVLNIAPSNVPNYNSPEWSDYVLSELQMDEMDADGHPLLNGLRRIAGSLLGDILFSGPVNVQNDLEGKRSYCLYEIKFLWTRDAVEFTPNNEPILTRTFRASADADKDNTDEVFDQFPSTIAESRAEARCLRKALGLKVISKEESCNKLQKQLNDKWNKNNKEEKIASPSIKVITAKCAKLDIDLNALLGQYECKDINDLSKFNGQKIMRQIKGYEENKSTIPNNLKVEE